MRQKNAALKSFEERRVVGAFVEWWTVCLRLSRGVGDPEQ
jgi:hypothetical protein